MFSSISTVLRELLQPQREYLGSRAEINHEIFVIVIIEMVSVKSGKRQSVFRKDLLTSSLLIFLALDLGKKKANRTAKSLKSWWNQSPENNIMKTPPKKKYHKTSLKKPSKRKSRFHAKEKSLSVLFSNDNTVPSTTSNNTRSHNTQQRFQTPPVH